MKNWVEELFSRYRQKGILIDTNILLLLVVCIVNRERISKFNRTQQFTPENFDILQEIILYFQKIVTTSNILTEVSNLAGQLSEPERSQCLKKISQFILKLDENYIESKNVATNEKFDKFGITDCGILNLVRDKYLVLSDNFPLGNYLQSVGIDVINFNHIRLFGWK